LRATRAGPRSEEGSTYGFRRQGPPMRPRNDGPRIPRPAGPASGHPYRQVPAVARCCPQAAARVSCPAHIRHPALRTVLMWWHAACSRYRPQGSCGAIRAGVPLLCHLSAHTPVSYDYRLEPQKDA
jgi:hypothetical protein